MKPAHLFLSLLFLTFATSSCATGAGAEATDRAADALVPAAEEEKLGKQISQQLAEELTFHPDQKLQTYFDELGAALLKHANPPSAITFEFHLVDDNDVVNAFAIPGGGIYIYSGLIRHMSDESELVAVLGHEIAHVTERHVAERLVAQFGVDTVMNLALGESPGRLGQLASSIAGTGYLLKYSRDQESQADRTGLKYLVRGGYDPNGMVRFFEVLEQLSPNRPPEFLSSHPYPENRIRRIRDQIEQMSSPPSSREEDRFTKMKSLL